jgi:hypothetical protein
MDTRHTPASGKGGFIPMTNAVAGWLVPSYNNPASAKLTYRPRPTIR